MDAGTLKTPTLNVVFTGRFYLEWLINFVGYEFGQKQSVKRLQNMVYNTTQHPPPLLPPPPATHYLHISVHLVGGGGTTVHKYSSFVHGGNSSQAGS